MSVFKSIQIERGDVASENLTYMEFETWHKTSARDCKRYSVSHVGKFHSWRLGCSTQYSLAVWKWLCSMETRLDDILQHVLILLSRGTAKKKSLIHGLSPECGFCRAAHGQEALFNEPHIQSFFQSLDVETSDAWTLFKLSLGINVVSGRYFSLGWPQGNSDPRTTVCDSLRFIQIRSHWICCNHIQPVAGWCVVTSLLANAFEDLPNIQHVSLNHKFQV